MKKTNPPLTPELIQRLMREMPDAVVAPLYLEAREQAARELERDVLKARAILAAPESTPYDRAWARAVLAECET